MIKLYLDEDVHKKVASALRLKGYAVIIAHEVQKQSLADYQQLEYSIAEQMAIFTFILMPVILRGSMRNI